MKTLEEYLIGNLGDLSFGKSKDIKKRIDKIVKGIQKKLSLIA